MGQINPDLVPTLAPGTIFAHFTQDTTLNVRWLTPLDPVIFEAINRPMYDIALRQLIVAKALDNLDLRLAFMGLFPFLIPCKINAGTAGEIQTPLSWIWDMHVSIPDKWKYLRLIEIKRISGHNETGTGTGSTGSSITGVLRLVFAAQERTSTTEIALFHVDYVIDSVLAYQIATIVPATRGQEGSSAVDPGELETITGYMIFRTLDTTDPAIEAFLQDLAPPVAPTDSNQDGFFDNPAIYQIADTPPGTGSESFVPIHLVHGTGMLVVSAWNPIPPSDSNFNSWLSSNNYPFRIGATRTSINGIQIPAALFREFNLVVPTADEPTGDVSNTYSPVWLSSIERLDTLAQQLLLTFSTTTILPDGNPQIIEFAQTTLNQSQINGQIIPITPITNLLKQTGSDQDNFLQGFGTGHIVLSSIWGDGTSVISDFFRLFTTITDVPPIAAFTKDSAILSSFSLSRISRYTPTQGEGEALQGSTARLAIPVNPSDTNRYITEADQGLGDTIDFRTLVNFPDELRENPDINPVAYTGALSHKIIFLITNANGTHFTYDRDILPRLTCLLGRPPAFGDFLWDGTYLKFMNGDTWITL
jgi:hypothetical protein